MGRRLALEGCVRARACPPLALRSRFGGACFVRCGQTLHHTVSTLYEKVWTRAINLTRCLLAADGIGDRVRSPLRGLLVVSCVVYQCVARSGGLGCHVATSAKPCLLLQFAFSIERCFALAATGLGPRCSLCPTHGQSLHTARQRACLALHSRCASVCVKHSSIQHWLPIRSLRCASPQLIPVHCIHDQRACQKSCRHLCCRHT